MISVSERFGIAREQSLLVCCAELSTLSAKTHETVFSNNKHHTTVRPLSARRLRFASTRNCTTPPHRRRTNGHHACRGVPDERLLF